MDYLNIDNQKILPVVSELNVLLADYHVYYQKLRNFHWNILGKNFFDLHNKFEEMYNDTRLKIDEIAERIVTLKYHPISKLSDYIEVSKIKESSPLLSDYEMVSEIIEDHKIILEQFGKVVDRAEKAKDEGTLDLIGAYIRELEKSTWMLNAWSKDTKEELNTSFVK
ncbi:DNA starvation/stationary phase protection protein [Polaribacter reichenbachii]|uniref:DNA starvation/stationary phase protection protein n=1 Tax=Polaribacter reichenbachii TaxID=996801 RepID=A0A1B8TPN8_9FLAO|nr:DNA starvation/stationary phase protection protein [Polaribacter reichenbachii]APZ47016.1 DNA starvation/stationary phase protection protein [Polaribacter reichenbachii]AUC17658.1 DNA starvation/stationary phase protection protein [Polaribacter reichenbachii]OBY61468.1 DNA starvation/stationary phase protection protein [Polaribacter reichenbachii]